MNKLFRVFALILLGISISFIRAAETDKPDKPISSVRPTPATKENNPDETSSSKINTLLKDLEKQYSHNQAYNLTSNEMRKANDDSDEQKAKIIGKILAFSEDGLSDKMASFFLEEIKKNNYKGISKFIDLVGRSNLHTEFFVNSDFEKDLLNLYTSDNTESLQNVINAMYTESNPVSTMNIQKSIPINPPIIRDLFSSASPSPDNTNMIRSILREILRKEKFSKNMDEAKKNLTPEIAKRYLGKLFFTFYMDLVIIKASSFDKKRRRNAIEALANKFLDLVPYENDEKKMYVNLRKAYNKGAPKSKEEPKPIAVDKPKTLTETKSTETYIEEEE